MKITRNNIAEHLFEYQLSLIGKTPKDALDIGPSWKDQWTYTLDNEKKLEAYAIPLIKKVFKCNKEKAKSTYDWFRINFGLKIYQK